MDAFRKFDTSQKGYLNVSDFKLAMKEILGAQAQSLEDVYLIFKRYDNDKDGQLNFAEFSKIFTP
jgi:Ca2+-binding EF-hand superfamily protein